MRTVPTEAEAILWQTIRKRQLAGLRFRRQHLIGAYISDFYCPEARLVIELDGLVHQNQKGYDKKRERELIALGYEVFHFRNDEIFNDLKAVFTAILKACQEN